MSRKSYLQTLLSQTSSQSLAGSDLALLKKIILLTHQGQLTINGQCPNKRFSLADYLTDDRRLILDLSKLNKTHRNDLQYWLHTSHQLELSQKFSAPYVIDESHGIAEEKPLGWWQRFLNSALFIGQYYTHTFPRPNEPGTPHLSHLDMCFSKRGAIIDIVFKPKGEAVSVAEEYFDEGHLQNVKRVVLTDEVVASLVHEDLSSLDLLNIINEAHPNAIDVQNEEVRKRRMLENRTNHQYHQSGSFLWRLIEIFKKWWFDFTKPKITATNYQPLCKVDDIHIFLCDKTGQVLVFDKRVLIDSLALCGGGSRIFSYLGVIRVLEKYGFKFKGFSGSSAGAIMASLLFLGYRSDELEEKFQWITDHLLLDYDIDFSGLSTTNKMKHTLEYFILHRVQDEIGKHKKWFQSEEAKYFLNATVNTGKITFATIAKLKQFCPELNFSEELIITGTNITLGRSEIFSLAETPDMEIAEAVKISASLPVIYKPTKFGSFYYTDGGVLNNLPLGYFKNNEAQFLSCELAISPNVLALQFDTGFESEAVYSNKPVYRENWLVNKLLGLLIGVADPVSAWVKDRLLLREHGGQTILIDVKGIKATKFDLDDSARQALINSGEVAAEEYIKPRFFKNGDQFENDEYLSATFENLESLLNYCGNKKNWTVLKALTGAIQAHTEISDKYKEALLRVCDALEMIHNQVTLKEEGYKNRWRKLLPTLTGLNRMKIGAVQENKDKSTLYCTLFPVLSQPWQALLSQDLKSSCRKQLDLLEHYRKKLNVNDQVLVFNGLVDAMEANKDQSHLFYYILKTLLVHARNEDALDEVKYDIIRFTEVFKHLKRNKILNLSALIGFWDFDVITCKQLLKQLSEQNHKAFYATLGRHYRSEFEWGNLSIDDETPYLKMVR